MKLIQPIAITLTLACLAISSCSDSNTNTTESNQANTVNATKSGATPSASETLAAMVAGCAASAEERAKRHKEKPLYERLGGKEKIMKFVEKLIALHLENELVKPFFEGVDQKKLATNLADFIGAGTGGGETYKGRGIPEIHAGMKITPEVFLSAGGDIGAAMKAVGWGANEQAEFMCIILSMKDAVVMK